jgi:hypothetical protein
MLHQHPTFNTLPAAAPVGRIIPEYSPQGVGAFG